MNILLINHYAGSCRHGMEYRPYYFAREWVRAGHRVTIIAATHSHVRTVAPKTSGATTEETIDGIRYVWLATPPYHGNGPARVRNIFAFLLGLSRHWPRILADYSPDLVIASSTYPLDIYPARKIARRFGARLVFEVHDLWPLSLIHLGGFSRAHPFIALLQVAEDTAYRTADRVVSLLPKTLPYMQSRGMRPEKWRWIPNGVDLDEWQTPAEMPHELSADIVAARNRGAFLVGYAGGHGLSNGLDTLVDAALTIKSCPIEFFLVGKGPERERLSGRAAGARMHFCRSIDKKSIPSFLGAMDVLYLGFRDEPLYQYGVCPNKLMDYMMSARPIIYAINGHDDSVDRAGCGMTIPAEDPDALVNAIVQLSEMDQDERAGLGEKGRGYVQANHEYAVLAERFLEAVR